MSKKLLFILKGSLGMVAIALAVSVLLTGCGRRYYNMSQSSMSGLSDGYATNFPIVLKDKNSVTELYLGQQAVLTVRDKETVKAFWSEARDAGSRHIMLSLPMRWDSGEKEKERLLALARHITSILQEHGADKDYISYSFYRSSDRSMSPVRLQYKSVGAEVEQDCNQWNQQLITHEMNENNTDYTDWGCVSQSNLAAMAVHPSDLLTKRGSVNAGSLRRLIIFRRYELGEPTSSRQGL